MVFIPQKLTKQPKMPTKYDAFTTQKRGDVPYNFWSGFDGAVVRTLEGLKQVGVGGYLMRGVQHEYWPNSAFAKSYTIYTSHDTPWGTCGVANPKGNPSTARIADSDSPASSGLSYRKDKHVLVTYVISKEKTGVNPVEMAIFFKTYTVPPDMLSFFDKTDVSRVSFNAFFVPREKALEYCKKKELERVPLYKAFLANEQAVAGWDELCADEAVWLL